MDVNTIFKDLSEMVQEGGETIGILSYWAVNTNLLYDPPL